jgi:hypothetical protein
MTTLMRKYRGAAAAALLTTAVAAAAPTAAFAQDAPTDPNAGALTFTGGLDAPSVYFFRGIRQEADPKLTLWPFGDLGLAVHSGDGAIKSVGLNVGVWNSLHTGTSGSDRVHYEEDFYTTLSVGFGGGVTAGATYMALTSPNAMFNTVKELQFKVSKAHVLAPYGFLAFELSDQGQADAGAGKGTYLELGVGPSWTLGASPVTLTMPVKIGLSLNDYYELADEAGNFADRRFGFFSVGGLLTVPVTGIPASFGAWNIHGGVDVLTFGDTTRAFNAGDQSKVVGLLGIGISY